tara:strand:- start:3000 stop:3230 length:231 start_codon:yes stop_codon:yes gene_type:complete
MKEDTINLSRQEANLLRFYGGFDSAIYSVETEIERCIRNKRGDWKIILEKNKQHLVILRNLVNKTNGFLSYEMEDE